IIADHRVVTLIGSGGSGKTRLAIQVGADELEKFPDGVRFVDLAPLNDASLVVDAIASAAGIKAEQGISVIDALVRNLEGTKTLIIIDNCEHVIEACADAVSGLLRAGESVRVLATSREPLGLAGEMIWRVPFVVAPWRCDENRGDWPVRSGSTFCRSRGRCPAWIHSDVRERADNYRYLPNARRIAACDRTSGGAREGSRCAPNSRPLIGSFSTANRPAGPAADVAIDDRLE